MSYEIPRKYGGVQRVNIMQAVIFCAIHDAGINIVANNPATKDLIVKITDFADLLEWLREYKVGNNVNVSSEVMKSLRNWFQDVPRPESVNGTHLTIQQQQYSKMCAIIKKAAQM